REENSEPILKQDTGQQQGTVFQNCGLVTGPKHLQGDRNHRTGGENGQAMLSHQLDRLEGLRGKKLRHRVEIGQYIGQRQHMQEAWKRDECLVIAADEERKLAASRKGPEAELHPYQ